MTFRPRELWTVTVDKTIWGEREYTAEVPLSQPVAYPYFGDVEWTGVGSGRPGSWLWPGRDRGLSPSQANWEMSETTRDAARLDVDEFDPGVFPLIPTAPGSTHDYTTPGLPIYVAADNEAGGSVTLGPDGEKSPQMMEGTWGIFEGYPAGENPRIDYSTSKEWPRSAFHDDSTGLTLAPEIEYTARAIRPFGPIGAPTQLSLNEELALGRTFGLIWSATSRIFILGQRFEAPVPLWTNQQTGTLDVLFQQDLTGSDRVPRGLLTLELPIKTIGWAVDDRRFQGRWPNGGLAGYVAKITAARDLPHFTSIQGSIQSITSTPFTHRRTGWIYMGPATLRGETQRVRVPIGTGREIRELWAEDITTDLVPVLTVQGVERLVQQRTLNFRDHDGYFQGARNIVIEDREGFLHFVVSVDRRGDGQFVSVVVQELDPTSEAGETTPGSD